MPPIRLDVVSVGGLHIAGDVRPVLDSTLTVGEGCDSLGGSGVFTLFSFTDKGEEIL